MPSTLNPEPYPQPQTLTLYFKPFSSIFLCMYVHVHLNLNGAMMLLCPDSEFLVLSAGLWVCRSLPQPQCSMALHGLPLYLEDVLRSQYLGHMYMANITNDGVNSQALNPKPLDSSNSRNFRVPNT